MEAVREPDLNHRYNRIAYIDEQRVALLRLMRNDSFDQIARIFSEHGAHLNFGMALLHRHHDLPSGHAMVHTPDGPDTDICRMERWGAREIFPSSYQLVRDGFLPYEFTSERAPLPPTGFLAELATFLRNHGLSTLVAIAHLSPQGERWLENTTDDGTISTRLSGEIHSWPTNHIITEWYIRHDEESIKMIASKACVDEPAGHRRTGDR